MSVVAVTIFVAAYVLIASDRVNKTMVALTGAAAVVVLPVITSHDIFYSHDTGIDWDVIFLLVGMMIIVGVLRQTGVRIHRDLGRQARPRLAATHHDPAGIGERVGVSLAG